MSRKNNLKLAKARYKAALERDKERRTQQEARQRHRHEMSALNQAVARLTFSDDHSSAGGSTNGSNGKSAAFSFSSFPSLLSNRETGHEERAGIPSALNGHSAQQEMAATHVSATNQSEQRGALQHQRLEDLRVRKTIAKGPVTGGRLAQEKGKQKQISSALQKKQMQTIVGKRILVRGKNKGWKEVIRSRDKRIRKQMKKRRKSRSQQYGD